MVETIQSMVESNKHTEAPPTMACSSVPVLITHQNTAAQLAAIADKVGHTK